MSNKTQDDQEGDATARRLNLIALVMFGLCVLGIGASYIDPASGGFVALAGEMKRLMYSFAALAVSFSLTVVAAIYARRASWMFALQGSGFAFFVWVWSKL